MNKRIITLLTFLLGVLLISSACMISSIRGSGEVTTESRPISGVERVTLSAVGTLIIRQGEQESLEIEAEDNLLAYIRTEVRGQTLEIGFEDNGWRQSIQPSEPIRYYLTVIDLSEVTISGAGKVEMGEIETDALLIVTSGAGDIELDALQADSLALELSGAGNCEIRSGAVTAQRINISGAGNYTARDLESQEAAIQISGLGNATVWAQESLEVEISGAGNVEYLGSPQVSQQITGLGKVEHLGSP